MLKSCKLLGAVLLVQAGSILFQQPAMADNPPTYTMNLYSTYNGATAVIGGEDVYISPYTAYIYQGGNPNPIYNGSIICDDFTKNIPLPFTWSATVTNADEAGAADKFWDNGAGPLAGYTAQQDYNAAAYLANELLGFLSLTPTPAQLTAQTDISAAIWSIFDPSLISTDTAGAIAYMNGALAADLTGPVYTNVTVWTADPPQGSQEFLIVGNGYNQYAPLVNTPEPTSAAILGFDFLSALAGFVLVRRYRRVRA
jgi:hypothetical protein